MTQSANETKLETEALALARQVIDTWGEGNPPIVVLARALLRAERPGWREGIEAAAKRIEAQAETEQIEGAAWYSELSDQLRHKFQAMVYRHCASIVRALHPSVAEKREPPADG